MLVDGVVELFGVVLLRPCRDFMLLGEVVPAPGEVGVALGEGATLDVVELGVMALGVIGSDVVEPGALVAGVMPPGPVVPGAEPGAPGVMEPGLAGAVPTCAKAGAARASAAAAANMAVFMAGVPV